jgi:hypothetical protein
MKRSRAALKKTASVRFGWRLTREKAESSKIKGEKPCKFFREKFMKRSRAALIQQRG